jgi:hypothetical protein
MSALDGQDGPQVFTGEGVTYFALASQKMQLKMEKRGLKSSGGPLRPRLAAQHGLKPRDSHDKFIEVIEGKMAAILAARQKEQDEAPEDQ